MVFISELKIHPSDKTTTFEFNGRDIFALEIKESGYKKVLLVPKSEINENEISYLSRQIIDNLFVTKIGYYTYKEVDFILIYLNGLI